MKNIFLIVAFLVIVISCQKKQSESKIDTKVKQFTKIVSTKSNIDFKNSVTENKYFNFLNYPYIYNGGGVAVGDINNDGLVDIYFSSNQHANKLYLNNGDFVFDDITEAAKVKDDKGWTTGVSMIDINNDGWLDIYICKSGALEDIELRKNKLFINQKDNTFKESAKEYGLDFYGFSVQAYFFDMDNDGDLDMYLVEHLVDFRQSVKIDLGKDKKYDYDGSDQLFRNDDGKFTNVTNVSGIVNKAWGLSASIGDFNNDGWMDVFVANDFYQGDNLYINNQNGTFTDEILTRFNHISNNSMGSDFADINNDLHPDLIVLDMLAEDHIRGKTNMASMNTKSFNMIVNSGYHHQYMANVLQLNNGNGSYSEISFLAGIAKTDWSWAPLIADFDNDGFKDVFVTNGIEKDISNQDFKAQMRQNVMRRKKVSLKKAIAMMPSEKLQNYIFKNNGDLTFSNNSNAWGITEKINSNGASYADLDNDGDLDLILNNMEDEASVYQNNATQNYIQIQLKGSDKNLLGIGAKVVVQTKDISQLQEVYLSRGYQSSIDPKLTFGIGKDQIIESIKVVWRNNKFSELNNIVVNQLLEIDYKNSKEIITKKKKIKPYLEKVSPIDLEITYKHEENVFDDFKKQILLPHSQSTNGPFIASADINKDGLTDFFVGGALGQAGELYLQKENGKFQKQFFDTFNKDKAFEDLGVLFFDSDGDGDQDLYVVSGGAERPYQSKMYQDRLYLNDGKGNFKRDLNALPEMLTSGQVVIANDVDNDGDLDLFVGGRVIPDKYPYSPKSYLLINENGVFKNKTKEFAKQFEKMGLITDAIFSDYDNDGDEDLIAVGEWTKIQVYENNQGNFRKKELPDLNKTSGLWFSIEQKDMDGDGDMDYFVGNLGLNSKFKAKPDKPFQIFCDDFDKNGTYDIILTNNYKGKLVPLRGKECTSQQIPAINNKFKTFNDFAKADMNTIFGEQNLKNALHLSANIFYSIYLENKGGGEFNIVKLPNALQISPIMDFDFLDMNQDGIDEIIAIGNMYNTEVETVRYDASYGNVLQFNQGKFNVLPYTETGFSIKGDAKNLHIIENPLKNKILLISRNNQSVLIFN
ncbi:MAG: VCBS repeat-containing protein [Flavobacteriaceae bacterium]|nr:VCBS repeat-containing protein [Flavobacteriaceae bacterium]